MESRATAQDRQEQFLALFVPCQGNLRAFIRSILWDRNKSDDVFQEVALVLWRQFESYDPGRAFGPWARGVAANTVLKCLDRDRHAPVLLSTKAIEAIQDAFAELDASTDSTDDEVLRHCLERLPEKSRWLVHLRYRQLMRLAEIAVQVKSTPDAVHKALARVRLALQKCVERRLKSLGGTS